jgi:hypothetical protein
MQEFVICIEVENIFILSASVIAGFSILFIFLKLLANSLAKICFSFKILDAFLYIQEHCFLENDPVTVGAERITQSSSQRVSNSLALNIRKLKVINRTEIKITYVNTLNRLISI